MVKQGKGNINLKVGDNIGDKQNIFIFMGPKN